MQRSNLKDEEYIDSSGEKICLWAQETVYTLKDLFNHNKDMQQNWMSLFLG
jgi:hypothetical protein